MSTWNQNCYSRAFKPQRKLCSRVKLPVQPRWMVHCQRWSTVFPGFSDGATVPGPLGHKGYSVPVNSVSSWPPPSRSLSCSTRPYWILSSQPCESKGRGVAWACALRWLVERVSPLRLLCACASHSWRPRGFWSLSVGPTEGVRILASKTGYCKDLNRGKMHYICLKYNLQNKLFRSSCKDDLNRLVEE